ncbi:MAG: NAD(P)H-dependent glycerol-3-phosphate dehydrogenase [Acidobacteria bacterium]|jgi:glycerol-3-phosphate dehydrogenase (NAD(P)+)|nr:NAD(P)H-dependent glycerol-3-phosphate dehydrogenase [Acidobacteriota bacterium]
MPIRVGVVGAGSWGTTVASMAALNTPTMLWARNAETAATINSTHRNPTYLGDRQLPGELRASSDLAEVVRDADVVVMAVPSHGFREVMHDAAPLVRPWVPIVSLTKGLERDSGKRMTEVVADELPGHPAAVLTGPNLAKEIMDGQPAASVVAIDDDVIARELQRIFSNPRLLIYTNPDVVGCEVGGVVKNVIAIAAGMAAGMGFGDNTRATIITRGLAEMARLGAVLGGQPLTFAGLAGMGDLIATCSSQQSRNTQVGQALGRGEKIDDVLAAMKMVAEGVKSAHTVRTLADHHGIDMPICEQVAEVCHNGVAARDALANLMARGGRSELE